MLMKRTDEFSKNLTEEQLIRRALLSATEEEYQEALRAVPEAPVPGSLCGCPL